MHNGLYLNKKPPHLEVVVNVEPEGFEPSSKQATALLSTCLVPVQFSWHGWPKTAYRTPSFLNFTPLPKP